MNKQVSLVSVTCKRDFELIVGLLKTVNQYIDAEFHHTIILNDNADHMPELLAVCDRIPRSNRTIIHCDDVDNFKNDCDAFSKQYDDAVALDRWMLVGSLHFMLAKHCETEYYVILSSRQRISEYWDLTSIIVNGKSPVMIETESALLESNELFLNFFKESYSRFGLDYNKETKLVRSNPPFVWKTSHVLDLLDYMKERDTNILYYINPYLILPSCTDSYLYGAWLRFNELTDTMYTTNFDRVITEVR